MDQTFSSMIAAAEGGDSRAAHGLFEALYAELHRLATHRLARNAPGVTLSATTLLHEAYLEMSRRDTAFPDRGRFMAYAARVMRGLIVDYVRKRRAQKRGGQFVITSLDTDAGEAARDEKELGRISDALDELATVEPALAEIVDLKFFCGFSIPEIAAMRNISERTVQRSWQRARIFLYRALGAEA
jgi:RNA polymerase sigma factor (TIGR02999 family)